MCVRAGDEALEYRLETGGANVTGEEARMHTRWFVAAGRLLMLAVIAGGSEETMAQSGDGRTQTATFAGGCFWCMEPPFEKLDGVRSVTSGYAGGTEPRPTYQQVSSGQTGHAESVRVVYDPSTVSYERLLDTFWMNIDPTQAEGQFADHGRQYRTAIFYHTEEQRRLADASKQRLASSGKFSKPIVTEISPAGPFYPAEEYHQDYYKKSPFRYHLYRMGSGRDGFIKKTWGSTSHE
jgi:methionine-S-sulfoxide reductase